MGKSPAKWIKGVLFRKKSSKSNILKKTGSEKESIIVAKAPSCDLAANPPSIANPEPCIIDRNDNTGIERENPVDLSNEAAAYLPGKQDTLTKGAGVNNAEILRQEQAAAMVQAAFRGYLARRAFWALKGIIRLQALIRGHLVRRQAIATLRCVQGIVKLQALVRGQRVRFSDARLGVQNVCNVQNKLGFRPEDSIVPTQLEISEYAFARKLLASSSSSMPLSLQYDPTESNSARNWLERWSSSRFWEHLMQPIGVLEFNSQKTLGNNENIDAETIRPKRSFRRVSTGTTENNSVISASEYGKPKNNPKKTYALQTESLQESPQTELERVKRSLRKISASTTEANGRSELVIEKPKKNSIKVSSPPVPDVSEQPLIVSPEKTSDPKVDPFEAQVSPKLLACEPVDAINDEIAAIEPHSLENGEKDQNISLVTEELLPKKTDTSEEYQSKTRRRRRSLSSEQEYPENGTQNTPTVPSYMAATASAKAKLRAQGSPRLSQDGAENGIIRRHSMPYSSNGKSNSQSPRVQKLTQSSGKGVRSDKSLFSSKDYNGRGVMQEKWRR